MSARACSVLLLTLLALSLLGSEAHASAGRRGLTGDLRMSVGLASVTYDQSNVPIADFEAAVFAGGLRFGFRWGAPSREH